MQTRAIGFRQTGGADVLEEVTLTLPPPGPRDLLVRVRAVSVNPVDFKVRTFGPPHTARSDAAPHVLGYDAAGVVEAVGEGVTLFRAGDEVFYAGAIDRPGSNAVHQLVDERIVGPKPKSISFADAAALPLTSITAWEILFDRMRIVRGDDPSRRVILVIAAAGGVGSIFVQLARKLTGLTVVGTASRPESIDHVRALGAHHVIDGRHAFLPALNELGLDGAHFVAALTSTPQNLPHILDAVSPQGHVSFVDDPEIGVLAFKPKSLTVSWEMMFTRSLLETADMIEQHKLLKDVARLVDEKVLRTTATANFGPLNVKNLAAAHRQLETGSTIGKIVLEGLELT